jgi:hypothetical protein
MDYEVDLVWVDAQAFRRDAAARFSAARARFAHELVAAAEAIERDPDAAAFALDGMPWRMLCAWYVAGGWPPLVAGELLRDLEGRAPELAWRVRLALRAPDPAARLAHARLVLKALADSLSAIAWVEDSAEHLSASERSRDQAVGSSVHRAGARRVKEVMRHVS